MYICKCLKSKEFIIFVITSNYIFTVASLLGASVVVLVVFAVVVADVVAIETFLNGATAAMSVTSINRAANVKYK